MISEKHLEILHDYYKETFARVREVESSRDRFFLIVIGLFALLSFEIGYPSAIGRSLGKVSIAGAELDLQALPLPALLNITWVLTLAIALQYFRTTIWVNRQYKYVHMLERNISPILRGSQRHKPGEPVIAPLLDEDIYQREGTVYKRSYPMMLNAAWYAYVFLFPTIIAVATIALVFWEWRRLPYPFGNRLFDSGIALALLIFLFLYQVQPSISQRMKDRRERRERERQENKKERSKAHPVRDV